MLALQNCNVVLISTVILYLYVVFTILVLQAKKSTLHPENFEPPYFSDPKWPTHPSLRGGGGVGRSYEILIKVKFVFLKVYFPVCLVGNTVNSQVLVTG